MKVFVSGIAGSFAIMASVATAEVILNVDGENYTLSSLMENCQSMGDDQMAQIACFSAVSKLVEEQTSDAPQAGATSVPDAIEALRAVAQYQDDETGLLIAGTDCNVRVLFYGNYFHLSRRNVSSIDVFSAQFDAAQFQYDELVRDGLLAKGVMSDWSTASTTGGQAIDSAQYNIAPKTARATVGEYAVEVANQLTPTESRDFNFVLVHPTKQEESAQIWSAFEDFVGACQS